MSRRDAGKLVVWKSMPIPYAKNGTPSNTAISRAWSSCAPESHWNSSTRRHATKAECLFPTVGIVEALWLETVTLGVIWLVDFVDRKVLSRDSNPSPVANLTYLFVLGVIVLFPMGLAGYFLSASPLGFIYLIPLVALTAPIPVLESTLRISQAARDELIC